MEGFFPNLMRNSLSIDEPLTSLEKQVDVDGVFDEKFWSDFNRPADQSTGFCIGVNDNLRSDGSSATIELPNSFTEAVAQMDQTEYLGRLRPSAKLTTLNPVVERPFHDNDDSGNYDPALDLPKRINNKRKVDSSNMEKWLEDQERQQKRKEKPPPDIEQCRRSNHTACSGVITLKIGRSNLSQLQHHTGYLWPSDACIARESWQRHVFDDVSIRNILPENLRSQRRHLHDSALTRLPEPEDDPTGKPAFHGCWECHHMRMECSIRQDSKWPCEHCKAVDEDCALIRPPVKKRPCETCKRKNLRCSYSHNPESDQPCLSCQEGGIRCIAGPTKNGMPQRFLYDRKDPTSRKPTTQPKKEDLTFRPCDKCLDSDKSCNLVPSRLKGSTGRNKFSCISCEMNRLECTGGVFETASVPSVKQEDHSHAAADQTTPHHEEAGDDVVFMGIQKLDQEQRISKANKTTICRLWTPVVLDCNGSGVTCHLCSSGQYAILGKSSESSVHGRTSTYSNGTQVCVMCTMSRRTILRCDGHVLVRLKSTRGIKFQTMLSRLQCDKVRPEDPWCNVCPAFAEYECGKITDWSTARRGCGLKLCKACASDYTERHKRSWVAFMLETPSAPTSKRPLGIRADVELLRPGGPMWGHRVAQQTTKEE